MAQNEPRVLFRCCNCQQFWCRCVDCDRCMTIIKMVSVDGSWFCYSCIRISDTSSTIRYSSNVLHRSSVGSWCVNWQRPNTSRWPSASCCCVSRSCDLPIAVHRTILAGSLSWNCDNYWMLSSMAELRHRRKTTAVALQSKRGLSKSHVVNSFYYI